MYVLNERIEQGAGYQKEMGKKVMILLRECLRRKRNVERGSEIGSSKGGRQWNRVPETT